MRKNTTVDEKPIKLEAERQQTDESLEAERRHTDRLLASKLAALDAAADGGVDDAREATNAVSESARLEVDRSAADESTVAAKKRVVVKERKRQDEALERERSLTDEILRLDREAHARILTALRPLARESTDRSLLIERDRSDAAVDNRDHFLGIVSHDLRNLLGGIAFAASSFGAPEGTAEATVAVDRIRRYTAHMDRLIGDLLDVASIEAGRFAVLPKPGQIADVLTESIHALEPLADRRGITIELEVVGSPISGTFDHDRMVQVVTNLLSNAVKFSSDGSVVTVRASDDGEEIRIAVEDSGVGIPEGMHEAVFERFWKAPGNERTGTGLGLFITRNIVEAHGGRVWAEARPRGGARFQVAFPSDLAAPGPRHVSH